MTEPATRPTRLPLVMACVALAAAIVYLAVVMSGRKAHGAPSVVLTTLASDGKTALALEGGRLNLADRLDFQVTIEKPAFVYVLTVERGRANLVWQPAPAETAWEPGTYAPDWSNDLRQLFSSVGPVELVVVAATQRQPGADRWSPADLQDVHHACGDCLSSTVHLDAFGTPSKPAFPGATRSDYP